jgi:hypothetical protein
LSGVVVSPTDNDLYVFVVSMTVAIIGALAALLVTIAVVVIREMLWPRKDQEQIPTKKVGK